MEGWFLVSGGYPKHASDFALTNPAIPAFGFLAPFVTDANQRRGYRVYKAMAVGHTERQRSSRKARDRSDGHAKSTLEGQEGEGSHDQAQQGWKRCGTRHIRENGV